MIGENREQNDIEQIELNSTVIKDKTDIASQFNKFFLEAPSTMLRSIDVTETMVQNDEVFPNTNLQRSFFMTATSEEVLLF